MQPASQFPPPANNRALSVLLGLVCLMVLMCCSCTGRITWSAPRPKVAAPTKTVSPPSLYVLEEAHPSSQRDATEVVLTVSGPVQPLVQRLAQPDRLTIDLPATQLGASRPPQEVTVEDGRLRSLHIAQTLPDKVRVTLALRSIKDYRVAVKGAPHRVVVALLGEPPSARSSLSAAPDRAAKTPSRRVALPPTPRSARGKPLIVIDPGHGGHDPGAIGPTGLDEKTVVLQIAQELRQLIQRDMPQYRVLLTRETDVFLPLGERAKVANAQQAQVFISIHANASPNPEAHGIETWYLSFAASARAKKIAERENMMSHGQLSTLELILRDMHDTDRINQSAVLARVTQEAITGHLATQYAEVQKRGVEGAPFAVLHRTAMPSILVETAFISNPQEEARLRTPQYRRALAQGIVRGLRQFLHTTVVASQ